MNLSAVIHPRPEVKTVGLVSFAHGMSHFYILALPPIFPLLKAEFGITWAALGFVMSVFALTTGIFQVIFGSVVDRIGGRPVLIGGLALNAVAFIMIGLSDSYWALVLLMFLGGVGNAVFHPADYAILTARVGKDYLGRAFGVHQFAGQAGWMAAPPVMILFASLWNWRAAMILIGIVGLINAAALIWQRGVLHDDDLRAEGVSASGPSGQNPLKSLGLLAKPSIFWLFMFFVLTGFAASGIQGFGVATMGLLHSVTLTEANAALTAYFVAGGIGVLMGGLLADWWKNYETVAYLSLGLTGALIAFLGIPNLEPAILIAILFAAGLFYGLVSPSRDVLVRHAAPPGQVGSTFGIITTGLSVGGVTGPVVFGWFNDFGHSNLVFYVAAAVVFVGMGTIYGAARAQDR